MNKFSFEINVTKQCNFACSYCFEGNHCDDYDDVESHLLRIFTMIDQLLSDDWWNEHHDKMDIVFWGGEPTLKPHIIKEVVGRYKDNDKVTFMMYSNGYLVDDIVDTFVDIKDKFHIQVSYDGNPVHDINRKHKNGQITSTVVKDNIRKLVENDINVTLKSTIKLSELHLFDEAWQDIKDFGTEVGHFFRYSPTIEYYGDVSLEHLRPFEDALKRYVKKELDNVKNGNTPVLGWLGGGKNKCGFFTSGMFVDVDGGIYYCHGCSYVDDSEVFKFGDINDQNIIDKLKDNKNRLSPQYNNTCDMCTATVCLSCNVSKYINSNKDSFVERWNDYTCQQNLCEYYKLFGKYDEVLRRLLRRMKDA